MAIFVFGKNFSKKKFRKIKKCHNSLKKLVFDLSLGAFDRGYLGLKNGPKTSGAHSGKFRATAQKVRKIFEKLKVP